MACELRRIGNKSIRQALVVYLERGMARADADAKLSARRPGSIRSALGHSSQRQGDPAMGPLLW